jgi:hypothetical protein
VSNINKDQLDDTIRKLDSIVSSGGKATAYDRFVLACLRELAATQDTGPLPPVVNPLFRAKLKVLQVIPEAHGVEVVVMDAVTDGTPEDNSFSKWTPAAELTMAITNPELHGKISPLDKFYVDFTLAEKAAVVEDNQTED